MGLWIARSVILLLARSVLSQATRRHCSLPGRKLHFLRQASGLYCKASLLPHLSVGLIHHTPQINVCAARMGSQCHMKARCEIYPRTELKRFPVPDDKVPWDVEYPEYAPVEFTSPSILSQPVWADLPDASTIDSFHQVDKSCNVDRSSYEGKYDIVNGRPRNPRGRTGISGRGHLGRWGPNHAGDPIVTRWLRDESGKIVKGEDGKQKLQFVAVQRRDNNEWALPGGMVNPGENKTAALMREFGEEALNSLEATDDEKEHINKSMKENFKGGYKIYKGYVDDPRNTDNAWMETKALNFHDEVGDTLGAFKLNAGDDAVGVQWMTIDKNVRLYASHKDFIKACVDHLDASW